MSIEIIARCNRCNRTQKVHEDYAATMPTGWKNYRRSNYEVIQADDKNFSLCDVCQEKFETWMTFPKDRQAVGFDIQKFIINQGWGM